MYMPTEITAVDVIRILGTLSDEGGDRSSRNRFIRGYLTKYNRPEPILADIDNLLANISGFGGDVESVDRAYGDLLNRLAEVTGFSVDYVKYSGREKITGIWKVNESFEIKVSAIIGKSFEEVKGIARNALLILPQELELGRPFVTVKRLGDLFTMVSQIDLPVSSVASILMTDDDYDKRIGSFMELIFLAFRKELSKKVQPSCLKREWESDELNDFMKSLKLPTIGMLFALSESPCNGEELLERINLFLEKVGEKRLKSPMALGAIMGALSKHYSGIKEELVLREGKNYRIAEKYRDSISEIKTQFWRRFQKDNR
jgi:hypothetical protein